MQLLPQSLLLTQFGVFRPPVAIKAVVGAARAGAEGDCIGAVAGLGFIIPESIEGF